MENQENTQESPAVDAAVDAAQPPAPELTITDLINLRAVIDVAVRRGAFGAAEITAVGTTFDKLNVFLNAVAPQQAADQATTQ